MDAISLHKFIRISPKKVRELARLTVGMSPDVAESKLMFMGGKASKVLLSVIKSAKANAVNNLKLNPENLVIKEVITQKGPFFKRWQPVARGTAHQIKKRTSHLKVVVTEKVKPFKALKGAPVKSEAPVIKENVKNEKKSREAGSRSAGEVKK